MKNSPEPSLTRRQFVASTAVACALGPLAFDKGKANAGEHEGHHDGGATKGQSGVPVAGHREGICATCRYWGGQRRLSEDRKTVMAESLGWCNNVDSPHFQTMRSPEAGPMKAWRKWEALG